MQVVSITSFFARLLTQLPVYLVWLGGAILAVVRWRQHPRVSLLAVIGLGVLFLNSLAGAVLNGVLPLMVASGAMRGGYARVGTVMGVCNIVSAVVAAVGYGLLLAAVFSGRAPQPAVEKQE